MAWSGAAGTGSHTHDDADRSGGTVTAGRKTRSATSVRMLLGRTAPVEEIVGDKGKGKDKGKTKKAPKAAPKRGLRPHELRQQQDASKKTP